MSNVYVRPNTSLYQSSLGTEFPDLEPQCLDVHGLKLNDTDMDRR
jgi:hypothetical protein